MDEPFGKAAQAVAREILIGVIAYQVLGGWGLVALFATYVVRAVVTVIVLSV